MGALSRNGNCAENSVRYNRHAVPFERVFRCSNAVTVPNWVIFGTVPLGVKRVPWRRERIGYVRGYPPPRAQLGDLDQNGRGQGARTALGSFRVALGVPRCTRRRSAPGPVGSFVMFWPGCWCGRVARDDCDVVGLVVGGFARHVSGPGWVRSRDFGRGRTQCMQMLRLARRMRPRSAAVGFDFSRRCVRRCMGVAGEVLAWATGQASPRAGGRAGRRDVPWLQSGLELDQAVGRECLQCVGPGNRYQARIPKNRSGRRDCPLMHELNISIP